MKTMELLARLRLDQTDDHSLRMQGLNIKGAWQWLAIDGSTRIPVTRQAKRLLTDGLIAATYHSGGTASYHVTDAGEAEEFTREDMKAWGIDGVSAEKLLGTYEPPKPPEFAKNLTQRQRELITKLRDKLDVSRENFAGSDSIRAAFTPEIPKHSLDFKSLEKLKETDAWAVAGLYIHSWVLPLLEELQTGRKPE